MASAEEEKDARILERLLIESGEKDRLKTLVMEKLADSGWKTQMRKLCFDLVMSRRKDEPLSVEEYVNEIFPKAKKTIPTSLKSEVVERIQKFAKKHEKGFTLARESEIESHNIEQEKI